MTLSFGTKILFCLVFIFYQEALHFDIFFVWIRSIIQLNILSIAICTHKSLRNTKTLWNKTHFDSHMWFPNRIPMSLIDNQVLWKSRKSLYKYCITAISHDGSHELFPQEIIMVRSPITICPQHLKSCNTLILSK